MLQTLSGLENSRKSELLERKYSMADYYPASGKSKKHRKKKSKSVSSETNGDKPDTNHTAQNDEDEETADQDSQQQKPNSDSTSLKSPVAERVPEEEGTASDERSQSLKDKSDPNGVEHGESMLNPAHDNLPPSDDGLSTSASDTPGRLEEAAKERDQLRIEVTELRKSLEDLQKHHDEELSGREDVSTLQGELDQARTGRDHAETKYQKLLGQVNTMKTQVGERLKSDAVGC